MSQDISITLQCKVIFYDNFRSAKRPNPSRAILSRLATGEATVMDLAQPFTMSQPAVSRHLRVVEEAGLITRRV